MLRPSSALRSHRSAPTIDPAEYATLHDEFHSLIRRAAGRRRAFEIAETLRRQLEPYVRLIVSLDESSRQRAEQHSALVDAILDGKAESAAKIAREHPQSTVNAAQRIHARYGFQQPTTGTLAH